MEVICTQVICDDMSVNVCSVYFIIIKIFPTCFVWGISSQYYMVDTLIFNNLYFVWMYLHIFNKCIHILNIYKFINSIKSYNFFSE